MKKYLQPVQMVYNSIMRKLLIITVISLILGLVGVKIFQDSFFSTVHFMNGVVLAEHDMQNMQDNASNVCKAETCIIFASSAIIQTALLWTSELRELTRVFAFFASFSLFAFLLHQEFSRSGGKKSLLVFSSDPQIIRSVILRE